MRKLTAIHMKTKQELEATLSEAANQIRDEIEALNRYMADAAKRIESLTEHYNSQVAEANAFIESIHDAQEAYMGSRSEAWAGSDQGDLYRDWVGSWGMELETFDVEVPEQMDEPEFAALDALREMPEQP